jgi:hypothetical protein
MVDLQPIKALLVLLAEQEEKKKERNDDVKEIAQSLDKLRRCILMVVKR